MNRVTNKEIDSVSSLDAFSRYRYFIKKIADFEEVWTIQDENQEYALSDVDDNTFVSLWSAEEFIKTNLSEGWENCEPIKLDLEKLGEELIPYASDNCYLINIFPVNGKSGFIVSVDEFVRDLNEELEQYD